MNRGLRVNGKSLRIIKSLLTNLLLLIVVFSVSVNVARAFGTYIDKVYTVAGASMAPTLNTFESGSSHSGDTVLIDKNADIERGDIIVLISPWEEADGSRKLLIKRVIAFGGDRVEIKSGVVYVNGTALVEDYVIRKSNETILEFQVPDGHVYFLGDNRTNSADSRKDNTTVDMSEVIGKEIKICREGTLENKLHMLIFNTLDRMIKR